MGAWPSWSCQAGVPPDTALPGPTDASRPSHFLNLADARRWSRTIGALGLVPWRRISTLRVVLVGGEGRAPRARKAWCGWGVHNLDIIDADFLEDHGLGEGTAYGLAHTGRPKADALAEALTSRGGRVAILVHTWSRFRTCVRYRSWRVPI